MKSLFRILVILSVLTNFLFAQAVIDSRLQQAMQTTTQPLQVIVTFKGNTAPTSANLNLLTQLGITKGITMRALPIAGVLATPSQINLLKNNSQVKSLYLNRKLNYSNFESTALTGVKKIRNDQELTARNNGMPYSGAGIGVLINDSGIDATHTDLQYGSHVKQNVLGTTNLNAVITILPVTYTEGIINSDNNSGHGTHCAGIVGGTGSKSNGLYEGAAPGADLIGYGSGAALFILDGVGGFDYAITHQIQYKIRVITNSWGSSGTFDPTDPVNVASKIAHDRGITVLFAAGNSGPGDATNTPYAAPWVITVAAGDKSGKLADFSSRGVKGESYNFTVDGQTYFFENRPTVTAPGVNIVSTRVAAPVSTLGAPEDIALNPAYIPFYTTMSGTSMATPHTAGIVALLLEANPSLNPDQIKDILQRTATNMPGYESWEVGAGYVNAYSAMKAAIGQQGFGSTLNYTKTFNANSNFVTSKQDFTIDYNPVSSLSSSGNTFTFNVPGGVNALEARIVTYGILDNTGNPVNLILKSPSGVEYGSGISLLFAITYDRTVSVTSPEEGEWQVILRGLRGDPANPTDGVSFPETINGFVKTTTIGSISGLNDIAGNPAEESIKFAVSKRLLDSNSDGNFEPIKLLKRLDLAAYLMMGQEIRQSLPSAGITFSDINPGERLLVESIVAKGGAFRDTMQVLNGIMLPADVSSFDPNGNVSRLSLTYSLVQSLGLQKAAQSFNGTLTVYYNGQYIAIDDASDIPANMRGYVKTALDLKLINAYFTLTQGPNDLTPVLHASFKPFDNITRADFAVIITRTFNEFINGSVGKKGDNIAELNYSLDQNYPNPFNPSTKITFSIPADDHVKLEIFNITGEKVATLINEKKQAGSYQILFNASNIPSGVYIYRIVTGKYTETKKMTLLK